MCWFEVGLANGLIDADLLEDEDPDTDVCCCFLWFVAGLLVHGANW